MMMTRLDEISVSTSMDQPALVSRARWRVSGTTAAAVFLCIAAASLAQGSPNLRPLKPQGWSDKIVVSTSAGSTIDHAIDSTSLKPTDILYVNWAVINAGTTATTSRFYTRFYVDDALWPTAYYSDPPLAASGGVFVANIAIGALPVGSHTIRLLADSTHAVAESDETDNSYTKTIKVASTSTNRGAARIAAISPSSPKSVSRGGSGIFPLSGRVMNGAVAGSTVRFYKVNANGTKGPLLGSDVTDANGFYLVSFSSTPSDSILAESSGGRYRDEVTGATVALSTSDTLAAIFHARASAVAVTPLTNMAAARARALAAGGRLLSSAIAASNAGVGEQYQIPDIIQLSPIAADSASEVQTSTRDQRDYGLVLAGIAQEAHTLGVRAIDLAKALATDMSDGILDGKVKGSPISITGFGSKIEGTASELVAATLTVNAGTSGVQAGIDTFLGGPRNRTGLDTFDILNQPIPIGPNGTYVTAAVLPAARSGKPYGAGPLGVAGGTPPYAWAFAAGSTHPAWLGLAPGGAFGGNAPVLPAGTPMSISPIFVVTVSDSSHPVKQLNVPLTVTITDPPPELHVFDQVCPLNEFCSVVVATAEGENPPFTFVQASLAYGVLPLGMHLDVSGAVSGTPTKGGVYPFAVCVTDVIGTEQCKPDPTITVTDAKISPTSASFGASGGSGSVTVDAPDGDQWTAISNDDWISITAGSSGSGNGVVGYTLSANVTGSQRVGTITIAGLTFTVTQAGTSESSPFDGLYTGTWNLSCGGQPPSAAPIGVVILNGDINQGEGTVSSSGAATWTMPANSVWNGTFVLTGSGGAQGSGTMYGIGDYVGCSGTWNVSRQ